MEKPEGGNSLNGVYLLIFSAVLMLFSSTFEPVRTFISYLYSPISNDQVLSGRRFQGYLSLFSNIVELKNGYEEAKAENIKLKSELDSLVFIIEDNVRLREIDKISGKEDRFVESRMFVGSDNQVGYIDKGSEDEVKEDMIIQYGFYYIGQVDNVTAHSSVVKLPYSRSSFIKVSIVRPTSLEGKKLGGLGKMVANQTKSSAIAIGKGDRVVLENISTDKGVADGDLVIVNDEKVGQYLLLGKVKDLNKDPSSSSIVSGLEIEVDYNNINRYFIKL